MAGSAYSLASLKHTHHTTPPMTSVSSCLIFHFFTNPLPFSVSSSSALPSLSLTHPFSLSLPSHLSAYSLRSLSFSSPLIFLLSSTLSTTHLTPHFLASLCLLPTAFCQLLPFSSQSLHSSHMLS